MKKLILFLIICLNFCALFAQQPLTLNEAINIGVKENPLVKMAMNNALIAAQQNTAGFAGMLPTLSLPVSYTFANNNTHLLYNTNAELNRSNAATQSITGGPLVSQTLYDGGKMFATRNKLGFIYSSAMANVDYIKQQLAEQIIDAYFDISKENKLYRQLKENDYYYTERYNVAKLRREVGKAGDQDVLQAEIDRNNNTAALLRQKALLDNAYITLNRLLNRNPNFPFRVTDTLILNLPYTFDTLTTSIINRNPQLQSNSWDVKTAAGAIREQQSTLYPHFYGYADYNIAYTKNAVGLVLVNQQYGPGFGVSMSYNLFTGNNNKHQINIAKLQFQNASEVLNNNILIVQADAKQTLNQYETLRQVAGLLDENISKARQNVKLALERFKLGNITQVDLEQAQVSYETASTNYVQSLYDLNIAGNHLLRVTGLLKW